jgi:DNA-directed RNA polymerase specialized sigma24 family protein
VHATDPKLDLLDDEVEELVSDIAQSWGLDPKPRKRKPKPFIPPTVAWAPCKHWGGTYECPQCKKESEVSANMARAQRLYEEHSRYVMRRLLAELGISHVNQRSDFRDVEQRVWMAVAARIGMFTFRDTPSTLKWLQTVVHSTVVDYRKHAFAEKRDVRLEVPLATDFDHGIPDVGDGAPPDKATPTADVLNRAKEEGG